MRLRWRRDCGTSSRRVRSSPAWWRPVPWFPSAHPSFGAYSVYARTPMEENRHGIHVLHPRYPAVPRVGRTVAPVILAAAVKPLLARLVEKHGFDAIDAHYFYPDGVAAAMLGKYFGKPVVITACGADLSAVPRDRLRRRVIRWAAARASGIVSLTCAVKSRLVELGVSAHRVTVLPNGVDLQCFRPVERELVRARVRFSGTTLLSVGSLTSRDGHDITISALHAAAGVQSGDRGAGTRTRGACQARPRSRRSRSRHFRWRPVGRRPASVPTARQTLSYSRRPAKAGPTRCSSRWLAGHPS